MKLAALALSAIVLAFGLYRTNFQVTSTKGESISDSDFECAKIITFLSMDNPIEKLPLTRVHIDHGDSGTTISTAYSWFSPYSEFEISSDCTLARRI